MKKNISDIEKHSAGAIVIHQSPFQELESYKNQKEIDQQFRNDWVIPFYFNLNSTSSEWIHNMIDIKSQITEDIILSNLGDFNWRTRSTGAYFSAITGKKEFIEIIGIHLIKSEVCFAGNEFAKAIASFNSREGIEYLNKYLDYYLTKPELHFDQISVATALTYLDQKNGTNLFSSHSKKWNLFIDSRQINEALKTEIDTSHFREQIKVIDQIREYN